MEKKEATKKQYAVWQADYNDPPEDHEYYNHYDSIKDAVSDNDNDETEVFEVTYKSLGNFKLKTTPVKVKAKKGK